MNSNVQNPVNPNQIDPAAASCREILEIGNERMQLN